MAAIASLFTFSCCHMEPGPADAISEEVDMNTFMCEQQEAVVGSLVVQQVCSEATLLTSPQPGWKTCPAAGMEKAEVNSEFHACIKRSFPSEALGVQLDISDGRLLNLCALKSVDCPVASYNEQAPEQERLQAGDYVVQVNDLRGNSRAMMKEVQSSSEIRLTVRRPREFTVDIEKKGGSLGLGLNHVSKATSLVVEDVLAGPVREWNDAHPDRAVKKGDRIISVNSTSGQQQGTQGLLQALAAQDSLRLTFTRPAGPELEQPEDKAVLSDSPKPSAGGA